MRLDIHTHLGEIPRSLRGSAFKVTIEEYVENALAEGYTHACVYSTDPNEFDRLNAKLIEINNPLKVYPVQWITDLKQKVDSRAMGVKLHSHRGWSDSEQRYGIDYQSDSLLEFLNTLPEGMVVFAHVQNAVKFTNQSRPALIAYLAVQFPKLKFVICHAGAFGLHCGYPDKENKELTVSYHVLWSWGYLAEMQVMEAVLAAKRLPNVWLDSSICLSSKFFKVKLLIESGKFGIGTDFPFARKFPIGSIIKQENMFRKNGIDVEEIHRKSIEWLERPL